MNLSAYIKKNFSSILKILFTIFIATFIAFIVLIKYSKKEISSNLKKNKCKGIGLFTQGSTNFDSCTNTMFKNIFNKTTSPLNFALKTIKKLIDSIKETINKFRKFIANTRGLMNKYLKELMDKLQNVLGSILYVFAKTKDIMAKMHASYASASFLLWSAANIVMYFGNVVVDVIITFCWICIGILNGLLFFVFFWALPLVVYLALKLGITASICFSENTELLDINNNYVKIKDCKVGDKLMHSGKILSLIKVSYNNFIYNYNNVFVTGDHLVYEDDKWIRIKNSKKSKLSYEYFHKYVYCLETENNIIVSNNTIFRDFKETNNTNINENIDKLIYYQLNGKKESLFYNNNYINHLYNRGFNYNTKIELYNNNYKYIYNLEIGDKLIDNSIVTGIVKLDSSNIKLYKYKCNSDLTIILSGSQYVFENNKWLKVFDSNNAEELYNKEDYKIKLLNILTNTNKFMIGGSYFVDYLESNNLNINNRIDNLVLTHLNNS